MRYNPHIKVCLLLIVCCAHTAVLGWQTKAKGWQPAILVEGNPDRPYLPDFSFAGYHWGEKELPQHATTLQAEEFGVVANDGKDDSQAILAAVAAAHKQEGRVVLELPPGRLILKKVLSIERSNFVLRGAGGVAKETTIFLPMPMSAMTFPKPMEELRDYLLANKKQTKSGQPFSPFSWTGGIIWVRVPENRVYPYDPAADRKPTHAIPVTNGKRGEFKFHAVDSDVVKPGMTFKLLWYNRQGKTGSLLQHLYGDYTLKIGSRHWENPERPLIEQFVTIVAVDGNEITIKEPLLHDLRGEWGTVLSTLPMLREVGIENVRIEFPETEYVGHHIEAGHNAIYLTSLLHGWVRNVDVVNADNAVLSDNAAYVTLENIEIAGRHGHYGIHIGKTNHMLARKIRVEAAMEHSLSFNSYARGSVISDALVTRQPTLDQHCGSNHQNLFDNIRVSGITRTDDLFKHGGAGYWKPTHGLYNTFWNIQLEYDLAGKNEPMVVVEVGGIDDGPQGRFIGMVANLPLKLHYGPDAYQEGTNRKGIAIPSLYEYQLRARLNE